ncbi:hypothetical protein ILUMI_18708 [Ignelater luminosus]|uniref:Uncharacterized protein n=1 Tax=Ignelater luminosus TaxID=2038154 RepID=A0A8K0CHQ0_IGNLU|nr:hypothetical protein ILUMI_18708 [Ignelater luminosus]
MKREGRGSVSVATTESENITVTKWMEKQIASSCAVNKPQNCIQRWLDAWILSKRSENTKHDLLELKAIVGRALINIGTNNKNRKGRPKSVTLPVWTLAETPDITNARRCHSKVCCRKTKYKCKKCNEPCCPDCFENFHA